MQEAFLDNEFWATVINSSANWVVAGAMVVQTIIFFIGFNFGLKELDKHKQKLKIEKKLTLIYETMLLLHELRILWFELCELPDQIYKSASTTAYDATPTIQDIGFIFREKYKENKSRLVAIRSTLRVNVKLINNPIIDKKLHFLILVEEISKTKYLILIDCNKNQNCVDCFNKIPSSFYEKGEKSLGMNSRIQHFINALEILYKQKEESGF